MYETYFWHVIFVDFVPSVSTVNAEYYSTLVSDRPSVESDQICYYDGMWIAATSSVQPRLSSKWSPSLWTTEGVSGKI